MQASIVNLSRIAEILCLNVMQKTERWHYLKYQVMYTEPQAENHPLTLKLCKQPCKEWHC